MKTENIYDYFDIKKTSGKDEILKAYRKKSKEVHPDIGGNREDFEKANKYYRILTNLKLKEIYDKTGKIQDENELKFNYIDIVIGIFEKILFNAKPKDCFNFKKTI